MKKKTLIKSKVKEYAEYFIKEIIPVTAGILIALSIGNWNQNKKDRNYIKEVLQINKNELEETLDDMDEVLPLQQTLVDSLDFYARDTTVNLAAILSKVDGFYIPNIRVNAWKALSASKIELIDYSLISGLSNIEEQKENLKAKSTDISNFIYQNLNDTEESKKEAVKMMLLSVMSTEKATKQFIEALRDEHWKD